MKIDYIHVAISIKRIGLRVDKSFSPELFHANFESNC